MRALEKGLNPDIKMEDGIMHGSSGGRFTKNLKITIHVRDIFILFEKHH